MKYQFNNKHLLFFFLLFMSTSSFAQKPDSTQIIEIESGKTLKRFVEGKLEKLVVQMFAVNYGNSIFFEKVKDAILITSFQEPNASIKISIKNKLQVREILYDGKLISSIEAINFDLENLPKNSQISNQMVNDKVESYVGGYIFENTGGFRLDKTYKLFARLNIPATLTNIDDALNSIADFFSQEDALLRIFLGRYAEQTQALMTGYLKTNGLGKIESGIIWISMDDENGRYEIYNQGKIIKTELQTLKDFQESIISYFQKNIND